MTAVSEPVRVVPHNRSVATIVVSAADWASVESQWAELCKLSPYATFFLGVDWVGAWIETYGRHLDVEILRFSDGFRLVGACLLVWRTERRGPVWLRTAYLNAAGEDQWEEVETEFNDLLCLEGWESAVAAALRAHLDRRPWDQFVMNGCRRSAAIAALRSTFLGCTEQVKTVPSHYIDLEAVRDSRAPFEMSLSSNLRYQIRHSVKVYRQAGELLLRRAESVDEAQLMLRELAKLHQERWSKRGRPGAFASPRFRRFHESVIARCFDKQQVDLVRVSAGQETIGLLYNFMADAKAYFYQCGFQFGDNNKVRPGMVTWKVALQWYADSGLPEFDLMAGDSQYQRSLANRFRPLDWCTIARPSWRNTLVDMMRRLRALTQRSKSVQEPSSREEQ